MAEQVDDYHSGSGQKWTGYMPTLQCQSLVKQAITRS